MNRSSMKLVLAVVWPLLILAARAAIDVAHVVELHPSPPQQSSEVYDLGEIGNVVASTPAPAPATTDNANSTGNATANATNATANATTPAPAPVTTDDANPTGNATANATNATANAAEARDSPGAQVTDPQAMRDAAGDLSAKVRALCVKAQKTAPVEVEKLRGDKERAQVAAGDVKINSRAAEKGWSMDSHPDKVEELRTTAKALYNSAKTSFENSEKELEADKKACESSTHRMEKLIAAADAIDRTGIAKMSKPKASFTFTGQEMSQVPVCDKVIANQHFQKWLAWGYNEDRDMQKKEVGCLAGAVDQAQSHHSMLRQTESTVTQGSQLSKSAVTCVVNPLAQSLFSTSDEEGSVLHPASASAVRNFLTAVETKVATPAPAPAPALGASLEEPSKDAVDATETPADKYTCLQESYKKSIGVWESEKKAIEDEHKSRLQKVANALGPVRLGSSLASSDGKCTDLFGTAFSKLKQDEQEEANELESAATNSTALLKMKFQAYMSQMESFVSDHGQAQLSELGKEMKKFEVKITNLQTQKKNAEGGLQALEDRYGTEKKLTDGGCVGNSCFLFTQFKTPTVQTAAEAASTSLAQGGVQEISDQQAGIDELSWTCRRHHATPDQTRNLVTCYAQHQSQDMLVCNAKEVNIGGSFVSFMKQSTCPKGNGASCKDVKQCSTSTFNAVSESEQNLIQMNCASL